MNAMQSRKLTRSMEQRITEDWQHELPGLGIYRPRHLLRRVGPLLIGVCLDRDSSGEKYKPCFHVHFLGKAFPAVSLTLCTQLRSKTGGPDYIEVRFHEQRYLDAISRLVQESPLPFEGSVSIKQVIQAYRNHARTPLGKRQAAVLYGDCIMLLSWCNKKEKARHLVEEALAVICGENEHMFQPFGGQQLFGQEMCNAIDTPDDIRATIDAQVHAFRIDNIPFSELTY